MKWLRSNSLVSCLIGGLLLLVGAQSDAARLIVTDSGGTEREVSRLFVTDSGSVEREIQRLFVVDSGGTARLVFNASLLNPSLEGTSQDNSFTQADSAVTAGIYIDTDRYVKANDEGSFTNLIEWLLTGGTAGDYEVYVTKTGDALSSGTLNSWVPLTSDRGWNITDTTLDGTTESATLSFTIRHTTSTSDTVSFTSTITAERVI